LQKQSAWAGGQQAPPPAASAPTGQPEQSSGVSDFEGSGPSSAPGTGPYGPGSDQLATIQAGMPQNQNYGNQIPYEQLMAAMSGFGGGYGGFGMGNFGGGYYGNPYMSMMGGYGNPFFMGSGYY